MIQWERATDFYSVCVDSTENGICRGRLYHRYLNGPLVFQNLDDLIFQINDFCNQIGVPEAWEGFRNKKTSGSVDDHRMVEIPTDYEEIRAEQGKKATFEIVIMRRQFNTWQGEVFWKEEKKEGRFNSITELMMMLTSAVNRDTTVKCERKHA